MLLLDHDDPDLQQFGARRLTLSTQAAHWPIETWLRLIEVRDPTAQAIVSEQFTRQVRGDRLTLDQALTLAIARAAPVAQLGLQILQPRSLKTPEERASLAVLGQCQCASHAAALTRWALAQLASHDNYDREVVTPLLDSSLAAMRMTASAWLEGSAAAQNDPVIWSRLLETPYEDLRLHAIEQLQRRAIRPRLSTADLTPLWTSVLVGVERGGRQKQHAIRQLAEAIADRPESVESMLPVLVVAVRSVRRPEQLAALAAIAWLLEHCPELTARIGSALPELAFAPT